jgi:hypothetical protein
MIIAEQESHMLTGHGEAAMGFGEHRDGWVDRNAAFIWDHLDF